MPTLAKTNYYAKAEMSKSLWWMTFSSSMFDELVNLRIFRQVKTPRQSVKFNIRDISEFTRRIEYSTAYFVLCSRVHSTHWLVVSKRRCIKNIGLHYLCLWLVKLSSDVLCKGHHYANRFDLATIIYCLHKNSSVEKTSSTRNKLTTMDCHAFVDS